MSESWNVESVVDSKPETPPEKPPPPAAAPVIPSVLSNDHSLGKIMAMAREARGFTREQAAKSSNIPGYYLTMIESDDYSSIADQLYLLPFLRRYAAFVGLEAEEVASRFIRDVQRADMNPPRIPSEPIALIADRKPFPWGLVIMAAGAVALAVLGWFGYRHFRAKRTAEEPAPAAVAAQQADTSAGAPSSIAAVPAPLSPVLSSVTSSSSPPMMSIQPASSAASPITAASLSTTALATTRLETASLAKPATAASASGRSTSKLSRRRAKLHPASLSSMQN